MKLSTAKILMECPEGWRAWILGKQIAFLSPPIEKPNREIIFTMRANGNPLYRDYYEDGQFHREDGPAVTVYDEYGMPTEYIYYTFGKKVYFSR